MAIVIEQVTYDYQMPSGGAPGGKGKKRKAGAQQEVAVRETALSGVSLTVQEGEFLGIIGHTGLSEEKVGFAVKVLITIKRFTEEDGRYFHTGRTFRRTTEPDAPDGGDGK